jgi:hypothetical protein
MVPNYLPLKFFALTVLAVLHLKLFMVNGDILYNIQEIRVCMYEIHVNQHCTVLAPPTPPSIYS